MSSLARPVSSLLRGLLVLHLVCFSNHGDVPALDRLYHHLIGWAFSLAQLAVGPVMGEDTSWLIVGAVATTWALLTAWLSRKHRSLAVVVSLVALPGALVLLTLGFALSPGLFVVLSMYALWATRHRTDAPRPARSTPLAILLLGGVTIWSAMVMYGAEEYYDPVIAGFTSLSRSLGPGWPVLLGVAAALVFGVPPRPHRDLPAIVVVIGLGWLGDQVAGPRLGLASVAIVSLAVVGVLRKLEGRLPGLYDSWGPSPDRLVSSLAPWAVIAAGCVAQAYLLGAWDCGRVARAEGTTIVEPRRGGFQGLPLSDGQRIAVSYREQQRLVLLQLADGQELASIDVADAYRPFAPEPFGAVGPEVLLELPQGRLVILLDVAGQAPGAALLLEDAGLTVLAAQTELDCEELTDAVWLPGIDRVAVACNGPAASADSGTGGSPRAVWPGGVVLLRPQDLSVDRMVPVPGLDALVRSPQQGQVAGTSIYDLAPRVIDLGSGDVQTGPSVGGLSMGFGANSGSFLATRYLAGRTVFFDLSTLTGHTSLRTGVGSRALACDGKCLMSNAMTGVLQNVKEGGSGPPRMVGGHVRRLAFHPTNGDVLACGDCGLVRVSRSRFMPGDDSPAHEP